MKYKNILNKLKSLISGEKRKSPGSLSGEKYDYNNLNLEDLPAQYQQKNISKSLNKNLNYIKNAYGNSLDLNIKKFELDQKNNQCALVFLGKMAEDNSVQDIIEDFEIKIVEYEQQNYLKKENNLNTAERFLKNKEKKKLNNFKEVFSNISQGNAAFFMEGTPVAIACETRKLELREIQEPQSEIALRGARDGFLEELSINCSLLRKRIRVPQLWFEEIEIGTLSKTRVAVGYIKSLASDELVKEVISRLEKIDIDSLQESGVLEEYIRDNHWTIFPLMESTERPDKAVSCLAEGKVVVITDHTPFVLIMPTTYNSLLQAPDDYSTPFIISSFVRLLRHGGFLISVFLPAFYVAIINFHPELIPVTLLLRISATREGVPFPVLIESLLMESIFEILREAGLRMPRAIGSAISIVGALVLGDAAISAGLVSPPMVIIVALTAIASFTTPNYPLATSARLLRYIFIIMAGVAGLFGLQFGLLVLLIHLCSLRSFGQPFFQPFGPLVLRDLKDSIIKFPQWLNILRPQLIGGNNPQRQKKNQKPEPEKKEEK